MTVQNNIRINEDSISNNINVNKDNFLVYGFVPQLEILKHTDLFIAHGGMNSANEAIYFGVPVVAVPQNSEQPLIAKRLEELELGKFLDKNDVSPDTLRNAVNEVLNNPLYKKIWI